MFPIPLIESALGCENYGPCSITRVWPPWQGLWAAATTNTLGVRSLEWRRPVLHANPIGHHVPAYLQKGCMLH